MQTCCPTLLGQTDNAVRNLSAGGLFLRSTSCNHSKVGILVHYHDQIRQEPVPVFRIQFSVLELLVVKGNLIDTCLSQKLIPLIHLLTQGHQYSLGILGRLDYGSLLL